MVLGNTVKKMDSWKGPVIEDATKTKNLWAESLVIQEINPEEGVEEDTGPLPPEQLELVEWVNNQLGKHVPPYPSIKNLSSNMRSGVVLIRLLEVLYITISVREMLRYLADIDQREC